MPTAYDRLKAETDKAWAGFVCYRDMGPDRTIAKVAREKGLTVKHFEKWSRDHRWVTRVAAYEAWQDRKLREAGMRAAELMRTRQVKLAVSMQGLGARELGKLLSVAQEEPTATLNPRETREMITEGVKLERLSRGEPGEIVQQAQESVDLSPLSIDDLNHLKRIRALLAKAT